MIRLQVRIIKESNLINLFDYGFANYKVQQIAAKNTSIENLTIENATKDTKNLSLLLKDSITCLAPKDLDLNNLNYSLELNENISAPITEGDTLGKIVYNIDGITYSSDLIAEHSVEKFNVLLLISQIALAIIVLLILIKLFSPKKKYKKYKKLKHDPRITKLGNILRKTSLDEFPQFVNILKGEMSLVGPRPYLYREKEDLGENYYNSITKVKPGITGYWQVNGRNDVDFEERAYMDTYYIERRGIVMDLKIILKTFLKIFKKEGAV